MSEVVPSGEPMLVCEDLRVVFGGSRLFGRRGRSVLAVDGVSLRIDAGRTLAVVGESGSGKSTLARAIAAIQPFTGRASVAGRPIEAGRHGRRATDPGSRVQMVFQDPYASLDPRRSVGFSIAEPIRAQQRLGRTETGARVRELLATVGLDPEMADRFPHEFSGGQRQRIAIARALGADPAVLVCDEATSALDVSVQAQIVNLLLDAQRAQGFAMLFVTHNLAVVRQLADDVAVMYLGRLVEVGSAQEVLTSPRHPYAEALMSAVPRTTGQPAARRQITLAGDPPDPRTRPTGCSFHPRCWLYQSSGEPAACRETPTALARGDEGSAGHRVACHLRTVDGDAAAPLGPAPSAGLER